MTLCTFGRAALLAAALAATAAATAQSDGSAPVASLDIPTNPEFFGNDDPSVRKATAIVNGTVITGTDVDQRLALIVLSNGGRVPPEELQRLRAQVLRNLVDESLQIQAAESKEIKITPAEVDTYFAEYSKNFKKTPAEFIEYLRANGSSEKSIKRQIHGEVAWSRLQSRQIKPFVNVSEEEVQGIIDRLKAAKGTEEFRIAEIFLAAAPETLNEARANASRIVEQIRGGASFLSYARQFSEASTAAVGGDLGWVRAEQLPDPLAAAVQQLAVGSISDPIEVPGGLSIIAIQDKRQVLMTDPRDAVLSLKQLSIDFAKGMSREQAGPLVEKLALAGRNMGGCGGAEAAAKELGAEVVTSDSVKVRELPPALQEMLLKMNIGQATNPFGSLEDGVRILVLCGRDDPETNEGPSFDQVYAQLDEERTNRRARRYLRDLRRDAVVDYR
jgi:peptidyl-prolyl cis-trans isomerase SurA